MTSKIFDLIYHGTDMALLCHYASTDCSRQLLSLAVPNQILGHCTGDLVWSRFTKHIAARPTFLWCWYRKREFCTKPLSGDNHVIQLGTSCGCEKAVQVLAWAGGTPALATCYAKASFGLGKSCGVDVSDVVMLRVQLGYMGKARNGEISNAGYIMHGSQNVKSRAFRPG